MTSTDFADRAAERAQSADLAGLLSQYLRQLPIIIAAIVIFVGGALAATLLQHKVYTATATVIFSPSAAVVGRDPNDSRTTFEQLVDTQVELLRSPALAGDVVDKLKLSEDPQFIDPKTGKAPPRDDLIAELLKHLQARRVGQTAAFAINYSDRNPVTAARMANAFAQGYTESQVRQKLQQARSSNTLISGRLEDLRQQVQKAEAAVAEYKARHNLGSSSMQTELEISTLSQQLAAARVDESGATAQARAATAGGSDAGTGVGSTAISTMRQQRSVAAQRLAELSNRYGARHPDVLSARQALTEIDGQIDAEVGRVRAGLQTNAEVARQRRASAESSLAAARGRLAGSNEAAVTLNDLQRDADAAKAVYEAFLARGQENSAQEATAQADARVQSLATAPQSPSSPNMAINLFLGLILGAGVGVGAAFIRERWNIRLGTMEDVETRVRVPYLGGLPTIGSSIKKPKTKDPVKGVVVHPLSSFAEAFRGFGAALMRGENADAKVIGITSALPKEGKTTTSICLARVLAMGGQKVVLVDCDLRRHSTTDTLMATPDIGMLEVIAGKATLDQALILDEDSGAWILPIAKNAHLAVSPFDNPAFDRMLDDLRGRFDVVVLDTAPILAIVDTRILAGKVDVLAMVVRWRGTPLRAVQSAIHMVEAVGGRISGVALSLVDLNAQARSGYGDPHYYYKDFKGYYLE